MSKDAKKEYNRLRAYHVEAALAPQIQIVVDRAIDDIEKIGATLPTKSHETLVRKKKNRIIQQLRRIRV